MYRIRCCCDNCGLVDFYRVPKGKTFFPFKVAASEFDENQWSHYRDPDDSDGVEVPCHNCEIPMLEVVYWDEDGVNDKDALKRVETPEPRERIKTGGESEL